MSLPRNIFLLSGAACGAALVVLVYVAVMSAPMDADSAYALTSSELADATGGDQ